MTKAIKGHSKRSQMCGIIRGILTLVVTINAFIQFLPGYISTVIGLFLACTLHYEYFPKIASKIYGNFANLWWIRTFVTFYAVAGYLLVNPEFFDLFFRKSSKPISLVDFYFIISLAGFLLAWPLGVAYKSTSKKPLFKRKFWQTFCRVLGRDAAEEWRKVNQLPHSSITRKVGGFLWQYVPGLFLTNFFGSIFFLVWLILSMQSLFFAAVLVLWLSIFLLRSERLLIAIRWRERPTEKMKRELLDVLKAAVTSGEKGMLGITLIFICLLLSCAPLYTWLPLLINSLQTFHPSSILIFTLFQLFHLAFFMSYTLLSIYQLVFWYTIIRRFPYFMLFWKNQSEKLYAKAMPKGGLIVFGLSWVFTVALHIIHVFLLSFEMEFVKATKSLAFWAFLIFVNSFFVVVILYSMKNWGNVSKDLHKDNYRIPLAALISLISVASIIDMFSISFVIFVVYFALLIVGAFYVADLRRLLLTRYPNIFKDDETFELFLYAIFPLFFFQ